MSYERNVLLVGGLADGLSRPADTREILIKVIHIPGFSVERLICDPIPSPEVLNGYVEEIYERTEFEVARSHDRVVFYRQYGMSAAEALRRLVQGYNPKSEHE